VADRDGGTVLIVVREARADFASSEGIDVGHGQVEQPRLARVGRAALVVAGRADQNELIALGDVDGFTESIAVSDRGQRRELAAGGQCVLPGRGGENEGLTRRRQIDTGRADDDMLVGRDADVVAEPFTPETPGCRAVTRAPCGIALVDRLLERECVATVDVVDEGRARIRAVGVVARCAHHNQGVRDDVDREPELCTAGSRIVGRVEQLPGGAGPAEQLDPPTVGSLVRTGVTIGVRKTDDHQTVGSRDHGTEPVAHRRGGSLDLLVGVDDRIDGHRVDGAFGLDRDGDLASLRGEVRGKRRALSVERVKVAVPGTGAVAENEFDGGG